MTKKSSNDIPVFVFLVVGLFVLFKSKIGSTAITPNQKAVSAMLPQSPTTGTSSYNAWVQQSLNKLFPEAYLKIDGVIGPLTRQYIMKFQEMWGIVVDGIVGPETDYNLRSAQGQVGYIEQGYTAQNTFG
jgi:peptidoglycan hydrolase-like protein with peptidoglycan-binding domain